MKAARPSSSTLPAILLMLALGLWGCGTTTLEISEIPPNTPAGSNLYVAGNFNLWDPGDGNFQMQKLPDGKFYITVPKGWGTVEYKFTRGDWTTVETDGCGNAVGNRALEIGWDVFLWNNNDTVFHTIDSWDDQTPTDCDRVTFRIKKLPKETPAADKVFLAGSFNDWHPNDPDFAFRKDSKSGHLFLDLPRTQREIEYKITRGQWDREEVDLNGDRVPNRKFVFGAEDTMDLEITGWVDLNPGLESRFVSFMVQTPLGTPSADPIYIVGNFNKWIPGDPRFRMQKLGPNLFFIRIRKPEGEMEYKFTRGPWGMEEVDVYGNHINNRRLRTSADTVKIAIPEWLDIPVNQTFSVSREEMDFLINNPNMMAFPVMTGKGEKAVKFKLQADIDKPEQVYIRVVLPLSPGNHNYGITDIIAPNSVINMVCPEGAILYACEGPYWNDKRPREKKIVQVTTGMEGKGIFVSDFLPARVGAGDPKR
jgi:hypothetical protein